MRRSRKLKKAAKEGPGHASGAAPMVFDDRKWKIRSAYEDIQRVQDHYADAGLMRDVRKHAAEQSRRASRIAKMEKKNGRV